MESLKVALERAQSAYKWERDLSRARPDVTKLQNRLRKVSPARMVSRRTVEAADKEARQVRQTSGYSGSFDDTQLKGAALMLAELDWWGIPRPRDIAEAERAKHEVLEQLRQEAGAPGDSALRAAGFVLLSWWCEQGNEVKATKVGKAAGPAGEAGAGDALGRSYAPSAVVAWLAEQFPKIVPWLGKSDPNRPGWTPALDAAYTVTQAWRAQKPPHWTEFEPHPPLIFSKPGEIR